MRRSAETPLGLKLNQGESNQIKVESSTVDDQGAVHVTWQESAPTSVFALLRRDRDVGGYEYWMAARRGLAALPLIH